MPIVGDGLIAELPRGAQFVQLVIPASQVLITRARLPHNARHRSGSVLAFAIEEQIAGDPDANQVSWLGAEDDSRKGIESGDAMLAVVGKRGLQGWLEALEAVGIRNYEVCCETLLLPFEAGQWSLAWDGREGFARTGFLDGAATDCGDRTTPPLSLSLALDAAEKLGNRPTAISIFPSGPNCAPDITSWQGKLGIELRLSGSWDWRSASTANAVILAQASRRWHWVDGLRARLRPAAWLVGGALTLHATMLLTDWALLAGEQRDLRQQMEARFRSAVPEAVAVVDPALQMRRKLAEARHAAGQVDSGDFLPMIEKVAEGLNELPPGRLRIVSYEGDRMRLEFASFDEATAGRLVARLAQAGLSVETGFQLPPPRGGAGASTQLQAPVITVRAP